MSRLWIPLAAALWFYCAGCSERGLDSINSDGGVTCSKLDEKSCLGAGSACVADYCSCAVGCSFFAGCRAPSAAHAPCPISCPIVVCNCENLSESDCIASESTRGCSPQYCPDCKGGQVFTSCDSPGSGAGFCADVCPASGCHGNQDCSNFEIRVAPGASAGCGICMVGTDCTSDGDCPGGQVCGTGECICTSTGKACVPGCAQTGCPEGQMCGQSNHCIPVFCGTAADCPAQFNCNEGVCIRKSCSFDSDCLNGFCVENSCYTSLGQCESQPV